MCEEYFAMTFVYQKALCNRRDAFPNKRKKNVNNSETNLAIFQRNSNEILRRFIIMDETWIHNHTPVSNKH